MRLTDMRRLTVERVPDGLRSFNRRWRTMYRLGPNAWVEVSFGCTRWGAMRAARRVAHRR